MSTSLLRQLLKAGMNHEIESFINHKLKECKDIDHAHSRAFFKNRYSKRTPHENLDFTKDLELRRVEVSIFRSRPDHNCLHYHLSRKGIVEDSHCTRCLSHGSENEDTPSHTFLECNYVPNSVREARRALGHRLNASGLFFHEWIVSKSKSDYSMLCKMVEALHTGGIQI